jgi:predicted dehydrogenase
LLFVGADTKKGFLKVKLKYTMEKNNQGKLKIAIVGCGAIFENNHYKALKNSKFWHIAYLVDKDEKQAEKYALKLNCEYSSNTLAIPKDINACLVATPNFLHANQSIELINRGFNVICEKPMALNISEAELVKQAVLNNSILFFIVHQMRFLPTIMYLVKQLENKSIQNIQSIDVSYGNKFAWQSRTDFYNNIEQAGGGVLIDLGVHLMDLIYSIWPEMNIFSTHFLAPNNEKPVLDQAFTCNGTIGDMSLTLRCSRIILLNNSLRIKTDKDIWEFSLGNNQVTRQKFENGSAGLKSSIVLPDYDPFELFWEKVAKTLLKQKGVSVSPSILNDGLKVMNLISNIQEKGEVIFE